MAKNRKKDPLQELTDRVRGVNVSLQTRESPSLAKAREIISSFVKIVGVKLAGEFSGRPVKMLKAYHRECQQIDLDPADGIDERTINDFCQGKNLLIGPGKKMTPAVFLFSCNTSLISLFLTLLAVVLCLLFCPACFPQYAFLFLQLFL